MVQHLQIILIQHLHQLQSYHIHLLEPVSYTHLDVYKRQIYYTTAEADRSKLRLAQLVCDEAKKINPDYAPIYNTLGLIKLRSKDVTGALTEFRKAATLDPSLSEAQLNIGAISLSARSYKQAEEAFQAVLKKVPNHFDATVGMGVALRGQRKADEAEQWYNKALQVQVDPKIEPRLEVKKCGVFYNLGLLYQDYKNGSPDDMNKSKDYYKKFMACEKADQEHITDSNRRIKDIDDTFKALEEQKKLEEELKKMCIRDSIFSTSPKRLSFRRSSTVALASSSRTTTSIRRFRSSRISLRTTRRVKWRFIRQTCS